MGQIDAGPMTIALASIRNTEAYLRWQGAQWVIALNLTALVALLYRFISKPELAELFVLSFSCGVVTALDYEWYNVLRRDGKLLRFWNERLIKHEQANGVRGGTEIFASDEFRELSDSRHRLQRTLERLTVWFIVVWASMAISICAWSLATLKAKGGF